jgi:hypothetical protein
MTGDVRDRMTDVNITARSERRQASSRFSLKAPRETGTDGFEICRIGVFLVNYGGDIDVLLGC